MNLPNKLTITRLILSPVFFIWYFSFSCFKIPLFLYSVVLILIYAVMELTDLIDGKIARKHHLVTDLGKVMDPFGDVISHLTFFTCFLVTSIMPVWAFIVILWREFAQSFMRMLLMGKGKALSANIFGKLKTVFYAICSVLSITLRILTLYGYSESWMLVFMTVLFSVSALLSALSFIVYIRNINTLGLLKDMSR